MDGAIKILMATAVDQTKKHQGPYKREFQRIGHAFSALGLAFREDDSPGKLYSGSLWKGS
jgi:sorting nexin-9/18/33